MSLKRKRKMGFQVMWCHCEEHPLRFLLKDEKLRFSQKIVLLLFFFKDLHILFVLEFQVRKKKLIIINLDELR